MAEREHLCVAAIDIGNTYSGWAFSIKYDFEKAPLNIVVNEWNAGRGYLMTFKTPTALLLNPDLSFKSFGYAAENDNSYLEEEDEHKDYYYFRRFKTILRSSKNLCRDTRITEEGGDRTLPAIDVFSHSIRFLKRHLMDEMEMRYEGIEDNDVQFVLTVPVVCDDKAKRFIREAAFRGGIKQTQIVIISEANAAYTYCQYLSASGDENVLKVIRPAEKCIILNLGGGTFDIALHQQQHDRELDEPLLASEVPFSGTSVDDAFEAFLASIIGEHTLKKLATQYSADYIDLLREFEVKKRAYVQDMTRNIVLKIYLEDIVKEDTKKSMADVVKASPYDEELGYRSGRLKISNRLFRRLFDPTIMGILAHIENFLKEEKLNDMEDILVVGGFAESELVQNAIRERFAKQRIIIPDKAGMAVLKGAVLYGHIPPAVVTARVLRQTYGCQHWPMFNKKEHPLNKLIIMNGEMRCKDTFYTLLKRGAPVSPGLEVAFVVQALVPNDGTVMVSLYISDGEPRFIDDIDCRPLATLAVHLASPNQGPQEFTVALLYGSTELVFQVKDKSTGRQSELSISNDFL